MDIAFIGGTVAGKTVAGYLLQEATTIHANILDGMDMNVREILPLGEKGILDEWINDNLPSLKFTRYIPPDTAEHFQKIDEYFVTGQWPPGTDKDAFERLTITLTAEGGFLKKPKEHTLSFYEIGGEKIAELYKKVHDNVQYWKSWDENLVTLLKSDIFVFLIPADFCIEVDMNDNSSIPLCKARNQFDWESVRLLGAIHEYRDFFNMDVRAMAVLFTKHDKVVASLPLNTAEQYKAAYSHIPQSYAQLRDITKRHGIDKSIQCFKSGVKTAVSPEDNKSRPARGTRGVEFYVREYLKLLYWLTAL